MAAFVLYCTFGRYCCCGIFLWVERRTDAYVMLFIAVRYLADRKDKKKKKRRIKERGAGYMVTTSCTRSIFIIS